MKKALVILCGIMLAFALMGTAIADTIVEQTLGEFSSLYYDPADSDDPVVYQVGIFFYDISEWDGIGSATISGQWGNRAAVSTAHNELYIVRNGAEASTAVEMVLVPVLLADTHDDSLSGDPYRETVSWSYEFEPDEFWILASGTATLYAQQTSKGIVRLGETTLTITPIPLPSAMFLLASGLLALIGFRKRM